MWETWVRSLGWDDPLEKGMATHSGILAWRIPWTQEPGQLQFMRSQRVGHDWATNIFFFSLWKLNICKSKMHGFGPQVESGTVKDSWPLNNTSLNCMGLLICRCFPVTNIIELCDLRLVESVDMGEPHICRVDCKLHTDFQLHERSVPLSPVLLENQLCTLWLLMKWCNIIHLVKMDWDKSKMCAMKCIAEVKITKSHS